MNHRNPAQIEEWCSFLRRTKFFSELDEDALCAVARKLQPLSLPKGATIYHQGDSSDALYIVISGRVRIVTVDESGAEKIVTYRGRGEMLGETSLLTGSIRSVTAKVDAASDFLVLYKQDFEAFLKRNPTAAFHLSRLLSQRLLETSSIIHEHTRPPELLGFFCDLPEADRTVFMVNLSLALTEQTRRRVLLLELSPSGGDLVRSLGLHPVFSTDRMLNSRDLQDPKIVERLTVRHPSGLEIVTLSDETFAGHLFRAIPPFLDLLRRVYDIVLVDAGGPRGPSPDQAGNAVLKAFLGDCDKIYHVGDGKPGEGLAFALSCAPEGRPLKKVALVDRPASPDADYLIPWGPEAPALFEGGRQPYLGGTSLDRTVRSIERLARAIGKIQVGLAMGSGAAYGYTIIGILKVLEREKIPIDFISGTSMGALIGAFCAAGLTAAEIEEIALTVNKVWIRRNFLGDLNLPWPHGGLLMGQTIARFLRGVLKDRSFAELPTPFACVATDIITGDPVVLKEGRVWEAVRGSLSLPLIFQPYRLGQNLLVDGGLVNPVPTSVLTSMGADVLIAIDLTGKVSEKKVSLRRMGIFPAATPGVFHILLKMIYTMQYQVVAARTDLSHVRIHPDTRNFSWVDFHKAKAIIPLGEEAAEEILPKIKARLPYFTDYCRVPLRSR